MALGLARGLTQTRGPEETRYLHARSRGGISFDGANDYAYKNLTGSNFGDDEGVSSVNLVFATVRLDNSSNHDTICYFADATIGDNLRIGFTCGGGYLQFSVYNDNKAGTGLVGVRSTSTISTATWYHLIGQRTWDDSGEGVQSLKFWINGANQVGTYDDTDVSYPALKSGAGRDGSGGG